MSDGLEDRRLVKGGVLCKEFFFVLLVLFGAFVLVKAFNRLKGFAATLAFPFCFS